MSHTHPEGLVVVGNVVLTVAWVSIGGHDADELHHAPIFVCEDVTVEDVCAGEVQISLPYDDSAGRDLRAVRVDHRRRDGDHVLPDEILRRPIDRVLVLRRRSFDA